MTHEHFNKRCQYSTIDNKLFDDHEQRENLVENLVIGGGRGKGGHGKGRHGKGRHGKGRHGKGRHGKGSYWRPGGFIIRPYTYPGPFSCHCREGAVARNGSGHICCEGSDNLNDVGLCGNRHVAYSLNSCNVEYYNGHNGRSGRGYGGYGFYGDPKGCRCEDGTVYHNPKTQGVCCDGNNAKGWCGNNQIHSCEGFDQDNCNGRYSSCLPTNSNTYVGV